MMFQELPDGDGFWCRDKDHWRLVVGELSHSGTEYYSGQKGINGHELVHGVVSTLPRGGWYRPDQELAEAREAVKVAGMVGFPSIAAAIRFLASQVDTYQREELRLRGLLNQPKFASGQ